MIRNINGYKGAMDITYIIEVVIYIYTYVHEIYNGFQ